MGKCSLCGSPGTNVSSCPLNKNASPPNYKKHFLAKISPADPVQVPKKAKVKTVLVIKPPTPKAKVKAKVKAKLVIKPPSLSPSPQRIQLNNCIDDILGEWVPIKVATEAGTIGAVYQACKGSDCDYILKVSPLYSNSPANEGKISVLADKLGIGAKIYDHGICSVKGDPNPYMPSKHEYIVMENLSNTMEAYYPYQTKHVIEALKLYNRLIVNGIVQNDLKVNNIMFDSKGKMYIIDYGIAKMVTGSKDQKQHIIDVSTLLLNTMFFKASEFGASRQWGIDDDLNRKYNQLVKCVIGTSKYLQSIGILPGKPLPHQIPTDRFGYQRPDYIMPSYSLNAFQEDFGDGNASTVLKLIISKVGDYDVSFYDYTVHVDPNLNTDW
jgi:predicted Ser/Thr protein kinase